MIQNAEVSVVFNKPKRAHFTPLFIKLHALPIAALIKFKALMFAYITTTGSASLYLKSVLPYCCPVVGLIASIDLLISKNKSIC